MVLYYIAEQDGYLLGWKKVYNAISPYQSLGYLILQEYLECYLQNRGKEVMCR